ncbi:nucleotidyltransferase domain-containing protein [Nocardioides sp.]|uniref:nucleotidyltransferase domain-containing protein n=1 Tax=Nocardioides sp. TaxID=35761 RepID=UPI0039E6BDA9
MDDEEFERLYGPWRPPSPVGVADLLGDFAGPWWIAGGWAIEARTGVRRPHEDVDVAIFWRDLPLLRTALAGRYHLWSAGSGALRPVNDDFPDLAPGAEQVWVREHARAPWLLDVLLTPDADGDWVNKRDPEHHAPLEEVTSVIDGIRYLDLEIVLLFKARLARPKDDADLAAALPLLRPAEVRRLAETIARQAPDHPWLARLGSAAS